MAYDTSVERIVAYLARRPRRAGDRRRCSSTPHGHLVAGGRRHAGRRAATGDEPGDRLRRGSEADGRASARASRPPTTRRRTAGRSCPGGAPDAGRGARRAEHQHWMAYDPVNERLVAGGADRPRRVGRRRPGVRHGDARVDPAARTEPSGPARPCPAGTRGRPRRTDDEVGRSPGGRPGAFLGLAHPQLCWPAAPPARPRRRLPATPSTGRHPLGGGPRRRRLPRRPPRCRPRPRLRSPMGR